MASKRVKRSEEITEKYGKKEIIDEEAEDYTPDQMLWRKVIIQAVLNVIHDPVCDEDLHFLAGGGNLELACAILGRNPKVVSRKTFAYAMQNRNPTRKFTPEYKRKYQLEWYNKKKRNSKGEKG